MNRKTSPRDRDKDRDRDRDRDHRDHRDSGEEQVAPVTVTMTSLSYKMADKLQRFVSAQGYIVPRSRSGLSLKLQRHLSREIKRARHLALLPFTQTV
jgi:small subunit ribosomal protein S18